MTFRPEGASTGIFTPALIENAMEVSGVQQTIFAIERYFFWIFGHLLYTNVGISHHCFSATSLWFVLIFLAIVSLWRLILEVVHEHDGKKAAIIS